MRIILGLGGEILDSSSTKFKSLSQWYIFYNRLQNDPNPQNVALYNSARAALNTNYAELNEVESKLMALQGMADAEEAKERRLLEQIFQTTINIDWQDKSSVKDFIDTFNQCLSLKEIYERNIDYILNGKGYSEITITLFWDSFKKFWNEKELGHRIRAKIQENPTVSFETNCEWAISKYLDEIIPQTIAHMLNRNPEFGVDQKHKEAYKSLLGVIGSINNGNSIAKQFYDLYHFDEIKQSLISSLTASENISKSLSQIKTTEMIKSTGRTGTARGASLEILEKQIISMAISGLSNGKNVRVTSAATGASGFKADNTYIFNVESPRALQALDTSGKGGVSRERNIAIFKQLGNVLKNFRNSFVVYSSAKNYKLNSRFAGYKGERINLQTFASIMQNVDINVDTFIGTILQTIKGAIGDNLNKADLEKAIAYNFAYLLFDDFDTIGLDTGDGSAIHIMDLNGVLIPLSFFIHLLVKALEGWVHDPINIIKVKIQTPNSIEFKSIRQQRAWERKNNSSAWAEQRDTAIAGTTISMHFLKDFKSIISELMA